MVGSNASTTHTTKPATNASGFRVSCGRASANQPSLSSQQSSHKWWHRNVCLSWKKESPTQPEGSRYVGCRDRTSWRAVSRILVGVGYERKNQDACLSLTFCGSPYSYLACTLSAYMALHKCIHGSNLAFLVSSRLQTSHKQMHRFYHNFNRIQSKRMPMFTRSLSS